MTVLPKFILDMPEGEARDLAIQRFGMRLAALYASEEGTLAALAKELGISEGMIRHLTTSDRRISPELAISTEKLVSRNVVQRELLRPDYFLIEE
jgi:hypothetical protein